MMFIHTASTKWICTLELLTRKPKRRPLSKPRKPFVDWLDLPYASDPFQIQCKQHAASMQDAPSGWVLSSCSSDAAFLQRLPCCGDLETNPVRNLELATPLPIKQANFITVKKGRGCVAAKPGAREHRAIKW